MCQFLILKDLFCLKFGKKKKTDKCLKRCCVCVCEFYQFKQCKCKFYNYAMIGNLVLYVLF